MDAALRRLSDTYAVKLAALDQASCQIHPRGDAAAWSVQDVVEHLILTYRESVAQVEKYLRRGVPTTRKANWKQVAAKVLVIDMGVFPRGQPAPEFVCPGKCGLDCMDGDALAALLREELNRLDMELMRCGEAFHAKPFASHFRFGPLSAEQWRRFHVVHGRLHLAQITEIQKQIAR